jgi:hypothetical protein
VTCHSGAACLGRVDQRDGCKRYKQKAAPSAEGGEFNHFALRGDCLNMNLFSR